jgi:hypothetical protein
MVRGEQGHHVVDRPGQQIRPHGAPQIAVGDNAQQRTVTSCHAQAAEALLGHQHQRAVHRHTGVGQRYGFAGVHQVAHASQARS